MFECAAEHVIPGARLEGEEPDLLSVAIEWLVSIHVDVKGVS